MTGFLWSDDAEAFFGDSGARDSDPLGTKRNATQPNATEGKTTAEKTTAGTNATRRRQPTPKPEIPGATSDAPFTVSKLNEWIKGLLTQNIPPMWVGGEIGNLVQSSAGHVYFTLKDATGQISAVMWRSTWERLGVDLTEGMAVVLQGRLDVYSPRGTYQLVVQKIEEQGVGALQAAFKRLYQKLHREGLFDAQRKKQLPRFPQRIGFVTSPSGAAIHDFTQVLKRRWPCAKIIIIPAKVQGDGAADEIARGIEVANIIRPKLDVLVVGRGGGSLEDLWAFNEEVVVRALFASDLPTISAVGHEIDVTLSDLAADVRALTPTEAGERVAPSQDDLRQFLANSESRLRASISNLWDRSQERPKFLQSRPIIEDPMRLLELPTQRLDEAEQSLHLAMDRTYDNAQKLLEKQATVLDALSPLKTLGRGYSLTMTPDNSLIESLQQVSPGMELQTRVADGTIHSRVTAITPL